MGRNSSGVGFPYLRRVSIGDQKREDGGQRKEKTHKSQKKKGRRSNVVGCRCASGKKDPRFREKNSGKKKHKGGLGRAGV